MPTPATRISFRHDFDQALEDAKREKRHLLLDFSAAPM
jgi:hypothetical protein